MRFFRAGKLISDVVRNQAMSTLGQPNGKAAEPWGENGDFVVSGVVYLALAPHQYEGPFWEPMIAGALASGAEEITAQQYLAARPVPAGDP